MEAHVRFSLSMLKRDDMSPSKNQLTAISSIAKENDCVVCLPKGHGKSLIFEIAPYMFWNKSAGNGQSLFNIDDKKIVQNALPYFPIRLFLLILFTPLLYCTIIGAL